ncbi:MAG: hypothetical protein ABMA00_16580, partial [Gemmatimonas sp.]
MTLWARCRGSAVRCATILVVVSACQEQRTDAPAGGRIADVPEAVSRSAADRASSPDSAVLTLGLVGADTAARYRAAEDTSLLHGGTIVGTVRVTRPVTGDSAIIPTHDMSVCKPFTETRTPSQSGGVGNAVVWLVGVTTGPMQNAPRRASLTLDRCRLAPRVQRMALGGTLQVTSRDAMSSRLRFVDLGAPTTIRAHVMLSDAGQVVPTADVALASGLVEVRDDRHPWVRAYIAVSPHPFVAITEPNGTFRFDGVPGGSYTVVIWHEQLG